jgi:enoyl-CoA hydratase/carnithine racemase
VSVTTDSPVLVERSAEGHATIVLNRPDRLNTLTVAMRRSMAQAIDELEADPDIRVLIVTGAGRVFTAGLSLDEWDTAGAPAAAAYEHDPVQALRRLSGPVIGAINGLAITGGVEIALACDVLIAAADARFADTHVQVGLLPGWGGSARMIERVGLQRAKELAFTGRFFSADEALAWGFVNRVVPAERLRAEAEALAREMCAGVPATLVAYKRLLDAEAGATLAEALRIEREASIANNAGVGRAAIDERLARLKGRKTS